MYLLLDKVSAIVCPFMETTDNLKTDTDANHNIVHHDAHYFFGDGPCRWQLSYRDVFLDFFKHRTDALLSLRSGDGLAYRDWLLYDTAGRPVAKLSASMQQRLAEWQERGYLVTGARVRFIVAWKPKDAPKDARETAVLLIDLTLTRREVGNDGPDEMGVI